MSRMLAIISTVNSRSASLKARIESIFPLQTVVLDLSLHQFSMFLFETIYFKFAVFISMIYLLKLWQSNKTVIAFPTKYYDGFNVNFVSVLSDLDFTAQCCI